MGLDMNKLEFIFLYGIHSCKSFSIFSKLFNCVLHVFQFLPIGFCILHIAKMHPVITIQFYLFVGSASLHPGVGEGASLFMN